MRLPCDAWGCVRFEAAACEDAFRLQWGEGGERDGAAEAVSDAGLGFRTSGDPAASGSERGPFSAADRRSSRRSLRPSIWMEGRRRGPSREGGSNCSRKEAPPPFSASRAIASEMLRKDAEDPFRNAPSGTQRDPCSARALPRVRRGSAPRTNVSRETFFSEQSGGRRRDRKSKAGEGEGQGRASYVRTNVSRETSGAGRARCDGAGRAKCGGAASNVLTDWAKLGFGERARIGKARTRFGERARTKGATFQLGGRA